MACRFRAAASESCRQRAIVWPSCSKLSKDISGAEVDGLRSALEKASEPTVEVQITECKGFIAWAEKRVADLDAQRAQEVAALEEGRASCNVSSQKYRARLTYCVRGHEVEGSREPIAIQDASCGPTLGDSGAVRSVPLPTLCWIRPRSCPDKLMRCCQRTSF